MSYKQSMWMHILVLFIHSHINIYTKLVKAYFIQISQINKTNICTWTYIIQETSDANSSVCSLYLNSYNHLLQNYTVTYLFLHIQSHICSFIYSHICVPSYTVTYVFLHIQSHNLLEHEATRPLLFGCMLMVLSFGIFSDVWSSTDDV